MAGSQQLLGVRGDVNWARPGEDALYSTYQADPDIINFSADLKLALPWGRHLFGMTPASRCTESAAARTSCTGTFRCA